MKNQHNAEQESESIIDFGYVRIYMYFLLAMFIFLIALSKGWVDITTNTQQSVECVKSLNL